MNVCGFLQVALVSSVWRQKTPSPPSHTHKGRRKYSFFFFVTFSKENDLIRRRKTRKEPHFAFFGAIWATDTLTHTYTRARKETSIEKEKKKKY